MFYGYSLGGVIAMEMARQLRGAGEQVALVGLGDAPGPIRPEEDLDQLRARVEAHAGGLLVRIGKRVQQLRSLPREELASRVRWLAGRQRRHYAVMARQWRSRLIAGSGRPGPAGPLGSAGPVAQEHRGQYVLEQYGPMFYRYLPQGQYDGQVLLLRARNVADTRPDRGWSDYLSGPMTTVDIDGSHGDLHSDGYARPVGRAVRSAIDRVLSPA
jgi:thioesterase domain-containing protein